MPKELVRQDLLFHPVHGLCRVDRVTRQSRPGGTVPCYSLVPKTMSKMKVRFIIAAPEMEVSGFHKVISTKEANKILDYLKAGDSGADQTDQTWTLARNILSFAKDKLKTRDQRKRQLLEHSIKGLVGELACVFHLSLNEAASRIEKNLTRISKKNPLVIAALGRAAEG